MYEQTSIKKVGKNIFFSQVFLYVQIDHIYIIFRFGLHTVTKFN